METDSDDTWTDDYWSSEETAMLEAPPPPPKALPPMYAPCYAFRVELFGAEGHGFGGRACSPPPPPLGARKRGRLALPAPEVELTEEEKAALAAKFKTNKEIRHEKRRRKAERTDHRKKK
jgi:hypothetical protein